MVHHQVAPWKAKSDRICDPEMFIMSKNMWEISKYQIGNKTWYITPKNYVETVSHS